MALNQKGSYLSHQWQKNTKWDRKLKSVAKDESVMSAEQTTV